MICVGEIDWHQDGLEHRASPGTIKSKSRHANWRGSQGWITFAAGGCLSSSGERQALQCQWRRFKRASFRAHTCCSRFAAQASSTDCRNWSGTISCMKISIDGTSISLQLAPMLWLTAVGLYSSSKSVCRLPAPRPVLRLDRGPKHERRKDRHSPKPAKSRSSLPPPVANRMSSRGGRLSKFRSFA